MARHYKNIAGEWRQFSVQGTYAKIRGYRRFLREWEWKMVVGLDQTGAVIVKKSNNLNYALQFVHPF